MFSAIAVDKFVANHTILMLKIKKKENDSEKNAKTHDIQQMSF